MLFMNAKINCSLQDKKKVKKNARIPQEKRLNGKKNNCQPLDKGQDSSLLIFHKLNPLSSCNNNTLRHSDKFYRSWLPVGLKFLLGPASGPLRLNTEPFRRISEALLLAGGVVTWWSSPSWAGGAGCDTRLLISEPQRENRSERLPPVMVTIFCFVKT